MDNFIEFRIDSLLKRISLHKKVPWITTRPFNVIRDYFLFLIAA